MTLPMATVSRAGIAEAARAGKVWLRTDKRAVSYADLQKRIGNIAALAAQHGLSIGDRVVIATHDDCEASLLFSALVLNGLTAVNLEPDTGPARAAALVARAAPRLVILDQDIAKKWQLPPATPLIKIVAAATGGGLLGGLLKTRAKEGLAAELERVGEATPPAHIPPETLAYILFTSGTTQQPKGVCISHHALFSHLATLKQVQGLGPHSVILNTLMLSHADGIIQGPVMAFYTQSIVHRPVAFAISTIEQLLDCVYRLRITNMTAVPTMLALMVRLSRNQDDAFKGGDFQLLTSCGAALDVALWEALEAKFGVTILNLYGLTETVTGGVFASAALGTRQPGSIGKPIDCELRLINADGQETPPGGEGELLIRGDLLMSGYFGDAALTREAMDPEGWFHTGDIAAVSPDGIYSICGRKKNIVIRGGLNIQPEEVSEVLALHPAVREALAFGLPDPEWGERLVAVVAADGLSEDELLRFCSGKLEPRKVPSRLVIVEELPKGRSGKVIIEAARTLFEAAALPTCFPAATPKTTLADQETAQARLLAIAASSFRTDPARLTLASVPEDVMGWDSLAHMEFVIALEQAFGINLTPRDVISIDSLGKALALVSPR